MPRYEYHVETLALADRWSPKRQAEELVKLTSELNQKGSAGWELMGLHSFELVGGITGSSKGKVTLTLWKREIEADTEQRNRLHEIVRQAAFDGLQRAMEERSEDR